MKDAGLGQCRADPCKSLLKLKSDNSVENVHCSRSPAAYVMHGLRCLIHICSDSVISSPVKQLSAEANSTAALFRSSFSNLTNLFSHIHGCAWPEADGQWHCFSGGKKKSSLVCYFLYLHHEMSVVRFHYHASCSAERRDRCCQHADSFAALASAFWHGHMWVAGGCGCHRL